MTGFHIDRLHRYQTNPEYRATRTVESLGLVYQCHYPNRSMQTARGAKVSPVHDRLAEAGARFKDVSGWEGADWYLPAGASPDRGGPDLVAAAVVRPLAGRARGRPRGRDRHGHVVHVEVARAGPRQRLGCSTTSRPTHVDGEAGTITYTQWLNERGTIEADLTVTKLDDDRFWVVATDTAHRHVLTHLRRGAEDLDAHAVVTDVTSGYAQLNVQGPRSRELLQPLTSVDLSNEAFPFRTAREIDIGFARVLCIRVTYVGELGYELYIPAEQALHVYDRLTAAGAAVGLRHAGLKALGSLRMEKGYRDYGHDIDNTDPVLEAGLGFFVALDKPGGFVGRDAVAAAKAAGPPTRRLVQVLVTDPEPLLFHAEVVHRDGQPVGYVRSASYGHTLGGAVGLAMVEAGRRSTRPTSTTGTGRSRSPVAASPPSPPSSRSTTPR